MAGHAGCKVSQRELDAAARKERGPLLMNSASGRSSCKRREGGVYFLAIVPALKIWICRPMASAVCFQVALLGLATAIVGSARLSSTATRLIAGTTARRNSNRLVASSAVRRN